MCLTPKWERRRQSQHWPGSRCPCWRIGRSSGTWGCCTCSCPAQPAASWRRSQFSPLRIKRHPVVYTCIAALVAFAHSAVGGAEPGLVSMLTSSSSKLDFISLEVSLVLDHFDETLRREWVSRVSWNSSHRRHQPTANKCHNMTSAVQHVHLQRS